MHTDAKRHHVRDNVYDYVHANALWLFKASLRTSQQTSQRSWMWTVLTSFCFPCNPLFCTSKLSHGCSNHCIKTEVPKIHKKSRKDKTHMLVH